MVGNANFTQEMRANRSSRTIYFTDLAQCQPQSALSTEYELRRWRTIPYEVEDFAGIMLHAGEETNAPDITYPLQVDGWYAIFIGVYQERYTGSSSLQVRLTSDPAFTVLTLPDGPRRAVEDMFWKVAKITDQQIVFGQLHRTVNQDSFSVGSNVCAQAKIAYIRLDALSDEEVQHLLTDRRQGGNRRLFAHNDTGMLQMLLRDYTPAEVYRELEPYRNTDFSRMYWEAGWGDTMNYPTKIGQLNTYDDVHSFPRIADRIMAESWRNLRAKGMDPFQLAADFTHEIGMEFHACYRPAGFYFPPFEDAMNSKNGFYARHPELRAVAKDGQPVPRLSYTFPATRQYVLSLIREMAQYPIDGVCMLFIRRPPLVGYEPPLIEGYKREYGEDPRTLDDKDPRWLAYRCQILTQFMQELRQEMDVVAEEQARDKRIEITAVVSGREDENTLHGMDLKKWITTGLVDTVIPYTMAPDLDSTAESWTDIHDVEYWRTLTNSASCKLALSVLPRWISPEDYRRKAAQLYAAGVENLFFWDCYARVNYSDQYAWNSLRRLGHVEEIEEWMQAGQPSLAPSYKMLTRLGDWRITGAHDTPG